MNFSFVTFPYKAIDQSFSYLLAHSVMTHKSCFETNISETLIGIRVAKVYVCLCDLFLDFEVTPFKFKNLL